jgi:hypothetical protein
VPSSRLRYRPLGNGAALFDEHTWKTHILNPAAAAVYEALMEESGGKPVSTADATLLLRGGLGLDPDSEDTRKLLSMLQRLGVVI